MHLHPTLSFILEVGKTFIDIVPLPLHPLNVNNTTNTNTDKKDLEYARGKTAYTY